MTDNPSEPVTTFTQLEKNRRFTEPYSFSIKQWGSGTERSYVGLPDVFSPAVFTDTEFFANVLPVSGGARMLEVGSGTGVVVVEAMLRGARWGLATDTNPRAAINTRMNAALHDVDAGPHRLIDEPKLQVYAGDIDEARFRAPCDFEVIFFNAPFGYQARTLADNLERSVFSDYTDIGEYAWHATQMLSPAGSAYLGFSPDIGDRDRLDDILAGYDRTAIVHTEAHRPRVQGQEEPRIRIQLLKVYEK